MSGTDFTVTPNFGLFKPIYNADDEAWGDHWNANADVIDAQMAANAAAVTNYLPLTGGTLSGPLQLPNGTLAVPGLAFGAADGTGLSRAANALVFGVQASMVLGMFAGSAQFYSTLGMLNNPITQLADAVNPGDALNMRSGDARYLQLSGGDARYLQLSGGALTGPLTLAADPAAAMQPVTLQYLTTAVAPALNNGGRNLLHNSMFAVAQRGVGPWTTPVYTADRWQQGFQGGTLSTTRIALTDADRAAIGDEAAAYGIQCVVAGGTAAAAFTEFVQIIEGVRRLSGKTVTVSFFAKAASGTPKIGFSLDQSFGTGGSPSAYVSGAGQSSALSTTWARHAFTFTLPSTTGKTLGTNGDDGAYLNLWFSSGTTNNGFAGSIGVQSATFLLWGAQLEIGSVTTPLEKPDPQQDLGKCRRFYQAAGLIFSGGNGVVGTPAMGVAPLHPPMRAAPTLTITSDLSSNTTARTLAASASSAAFINATVSAAGNWLLNVAFTASADL